MGEYHNSRDDNQTEYTKTIAIQTKIVDKMISKYQKQNVFFYSEVPSTFVDEFPSSPFSSTRMIQEVKAKIGDKNVRLSSVSFCDRESEGSCDDKYADDIEKLFKEQTQTSYCIVVATGFHHIRSLEKILQKRIKDVKIITVNTISLAQLSYLKSKGTQLENGILKILEEFIPSYESESEFQFKPIVMVNSNGDKIYMCPICNYLTGTRAPLDPQNTSLFTHSLTCPNKGLIPVE